MLLQDQLIPAVLAAFRVGRITEQPQQVKVSIPRSIEDCKKAETFRMSFNGKAIKAVLLDITGVLTESTSDGSRPIEGSVDAVKRIVDAG